MDKLKSISRRAFITDSSRRENSAEHSWHLAIAILAMKEKFCLDVDLLKTMKMALVHDICEIGAGDVSVFDPERDKKLIEEQKYLQQLSGLPIQFAGEIKLLWEEYEQQQTAESRWVKIVDRLLPFMMNITTQGKTWQEQGIKKSQVIGINQWIACESPDIYQWMLDEMNVAVENGWLIDA